MGTSDMHVELKSVAGYQDEHHPKEMKSVITGDYICTVCDSMIAIYESCGRQFQAKVDIGLE
jgi:hypothetical protein